MAFAEVDRPIPTLKRRVGDITHRTADSMAGSRGSMHRITDCMEERGVGAIELGTRSSTEVFNASIRRLREWSRRRDESKQGLHASISGLQRARGALRSEFRLPAAS